jgi:hypothetical protein
MTDETIRIARAFRPTLILYPRLRVLGRLVADLLMLHEAFPPGWPTRYVPFNGSRGALPSWLLEPLSRPRVCVTLGSVAPGLMGVAAVRPVLEALAGRDVEAALA